LAWSGPDTNNIAQLWVETIGKNDAKIITVDTKRGIGYWASAGNGRTIL
jgi:hypothetical protein